MIKLACSLIMVVGIGGICRGQSNLFPTAGSVGIGTQTPRSTLEIQNSIASLNITSTKHTESMTDNEEIGSINFYKHYGIANTAAIKLLQAGDGDHYAQGHLAFYISGSSNPYTSLPGERMTITYVGDVGIGTSNTKGYKLAVAGNMIAETIKVKIASTWPDFVFTKEYKIPTLQQTEKHIKEKGHLPGIPSAEEVKANGINLGGMNATLLQKIEELTLYLIELKKENVEQQKEIDKLKKR